MAALITHHHPCNINSNFFNPFATRSISSPISTLAITPKPHFIFSCNLYFSREPPKFKLTHLTFCSKNGIFEGLNDIVSSRRGDGEELEELELLLKKPSPKPDEDEILEPFYKFFRPFEEQTNQTQIPVEEETEKVGVVYYEPKVGDFVVGVVVSGNENKLDVDVGADSLGIMLTKEVLPLYGKEMESLLCDFHRDAEEFLVPGKVGVVINEDALYGEPMQGKPVVDLGTVLFAEVLGRTLGGRPLLSTRRLFRRMAWHRARLSN